MATQKITLYMDVFPGMDFRYLNATSNPGEKSKGFTRYAIDVNISDPNKPDEYLPVHNIQEVDKG